MIGFIEGYLAQKQPPHLLVNVNGLGNEQYLQVREDSHRLYGFNTIRQRDLFRSLLKVSGVGPRVALAILSGLNTEEFERCIGDGDIAQLTRVPGIGRKTAERLLVEMRDRMSELAVASPEGLAGGAENAEQDAVSALLALGYKPAEAARALRAVRQAGMSSEELIRGALTALARVSS